MSNNETLRIAFMGNPNCGKTTLYNAYTGANLKVANWPGVTVERKESYIDFHGHHIKLVDLPGTYSLTSYTMEEKVSQEYVLNDDVDVVIDVVDASSLETSLYLTLQLLELNKPVVLALNMMDIVLKRGMEIDTNRLSQLLGVPVVKTCARKREGLQSLMHSGVHAVEDRSSFAGCSGSSQVGGGRGRRKERFTSIYGADLEIRIEKLAAQVSQVYPECTNTRWAAIGLLQHEQMALRAYPKVSVDESGLEDDFIRKRYDFIERVVNECVFNKQACARESDAIDKVLCNRYASIPIFMLIMAAVFVLTFALGDGIKEVFENYLGVFEDMAKAALDSWGATPPVISLLVDGIINGVGTVLTFLPNIFILFLALAFLEDSGYMSRVAYVMDGLMGKLGLSGRAFIPMILGFGCTVPAVMASRTLEDETDRKKVMLVTPFMSCSARLPIYILLSGMFFPDHASLVAYSMYLLGILVAFATLWAMQKTSFARNQSDMLLIELPEYKMPDAHTVWIYVWEKVKDYVGRAGTVIFLASCVMWFLLNFGVSGYVADDISASFGAVIGHLMAPVFAPCGLGDWRIVMALLAGISAKEVVVSSISVLFGATSTAALSAKLLAIGFGPANALALMVFCLLYVPCLAAIATIRRESDSKWTWITLIYQMVVAWVLSFIVYHIASLLVI